MSSASPIPDPLAYVLTKLEGVRRIANGYEALCPAHEDDNPSLTVSWSDRAGESGGVVLRCHRGCDTADVIAAAGLEWKDLYPPKPGRRGQRRSSTGAPRSAPAPAKKKASSKGRIVATYDYHDERGELLYQVLRFEPKDFRQRKPNGEGGWTWSLGNVRRVPFRLPQLRRAIEEGRVVFVVEGEKDVLTLDQHGFVATCNAGGADQQGTGSKWKPELNEHFLGARVVILPDNDEPGLAHAQAVASQLRGIAKEVRIVELPLGPRLPKHGKDVTDWFAAGNTAEDLKRIVRSSEPPDRPEFVTGEHCTDMGNARRLVRLHGEDLRYVPPWDQWLVWDDARWAKDETGEVMRRAKQTALSIFREAAEGRNSEALGKHAVRSQSEARIRAMVSLARSEPEIPVLPSQLDTDPWALNALNGTIDLRTGKLREHRRSELHTKVVPVEYDPDAECPTWIAFLEQIMGGDQELIGFVQRAVGYSLTGVTSEQVLFFGLGTGANGKSTFLEVLSTIFGDYATQIDCSSLTTQRQETTRNDLARLFGARLVSGAEWEDGHRLSEVTVKALTGGDKIVARFLHKEYFEFTPAFKLWIAANHKPVIRGTDHAIWRRIRLIPFAVTIPEEQRDKELPEKLLAERAGVLAWAVRGCIEWQKSGLGLPKAVRDATDGYREEMDSLGSFLEDRCEMHPTATVTPKTLWEAYLKWCEESGETPLKSQTLFGKRLTERGITRDRGTRGERLYLGIRLRLPFDTFDTFDADRGDFKQKSLYKETLQSQRQTRQTRQETDLRSLFSEDEGDE